MFNWSGHHEFAAATVHQPTTVEEVQQIVAAAPRVRALGSRHSFNDLADGVEVVSVEGLPADVRIDAASRIAWFGAGLRYGDLATELHAAGWAIPNLASLPHITVAGAVATGTHGSGDRNGNLATSVAGLELVTADGSLLRVIRGDADFDGMVVALGALGIVTRIALDIEPAFDVRQDVFTGMSWSTLLENYDAITSSAYSVSVFTGWAGGDVGTVWLKSRMDAAQPPASLFGAVRSPVNLHPLPNMPAENATQQVGIAGPWNDRLAHFKLGFTPSSGDELQTEYLVPRGNAVAAIEIVRSMRDGISPLLHITELRTMAADSLWLSGAYGTDAVGIHFTWKKQPELVLPLLPVLEAALEPFDVRPHWGKLFSAVRPELYPRLGDFAALATRLDPEGKFRNDFLDRHVFRTVP